jgi:hypothetical protein
VSVGTPAEMGTFRTALTDVLAHLRATSERPTTHLPEEVEVT